MARVERGGDPDAVRPPGPGRSPRRRRDRPALGGFSPLQLLLLVALAAAVLAAAGAALAVNRDRAEAQREERIERAVVALRQQVAQAQDALLGARGLFSAAGELTQDRFGRFAEPLLGRSGLGALFEAKRVPAADRAAFEAEAGTSIKGVQLLPRPGLQPAPPRAVYRPVRLLAPNTPGARQLIGLDLSFIPGLPEALFHARDSGRIVAAPPFAIRSEAPALVLVAAHYRPGLPLRTPAQRDAALVGYLGSFYQADSFAQAALETLPPAARLQIFDGPRRIYGDPDAGPGIERTVDIAGRPWRLRLHLEADPALALPATILGGGILLTALVALLFLTGNRREHRISAAERELRRQAGVTQTLLDAVPDGIMLVGADGRVLVTNPAFARIIAAIDGSRVETDSIDELVAGLARHVADSERYLEVQSRLRSDPSLVLDEEWQMRNGQIYRQFTAPVRMGSPDEPVTARVIIVRDVTLERRVDRVKDEFIATASHELRTPLTSILGYLEALREGDAGDLAPEQERFLEVIARNGERLRHLVDDLLDVARADAGRLALAMAEVDLGRVVAEASEAARPVAAERGIALSVRAEPGARVIGDRTRLGQVVDNLVSNALKFTPPGGSVNVTVAPEGAEVVCEVADTGVGIPAAEQDRLFERFFRGSRASTDAVQGSGLGLAIAKMIVESHGGRIALTSEEGRGTRVRVTLPAAVPVPAGSPAGP
jgi:signal transduction histidine kinase